MEKFWKINVIVEEKVKDEKISKSCRQISTCMFLAEVGVLLICTEYGAVAGFTIAAQKLERFERNIDQIKRKLWWNSRISRLIMSTR